MEDNTNHRRDERPEDSEMEIFPTFVARIVSIQKQMDQKYEGDGFIIEELMTAVEIHRRA